MALTGTTSNLGLVNVGGNHPENQSATSALGGNIEVKSAAGAIASTQGKVMITKGSAAALTLAAPVAGLPAAGGNDGQRLAIISTTAVAHVVTASTNVINGNKHIATFPASAGAAVEVVAYNSIRWTVANGTTLT